jgi:hypothetical protein
MSRMANEAGRLPISLGLGGVRETICAPQSEVPGRCQAGRWVSCSSPEPLGWFREGDDGVIEQRTHS